MAIIKGRVPKAEKAKDQPRLVIKFSSAAEAARSTEIQRLLKSLSAKAKAVPLLGENEELTAGARRVLANYVSISLPTGVSIGKAEELAARLARHSAVESAYVSGGLCPPPMNPNDDPRSANQGYLDAAPAGIDARWAWGVTDGSSVGFVDLEQGWVLDHEDLVGAAITVISGVNNAYRGHGTAVLGEIVATDNGIGGIGISPASRARVVSQWRTASNGDTAAAILSAADNMAKGDVLLLEAQTTVGASTYLPVEVETAVFDAIRHAVDQGVIVIEAGGNGSNDLDNFKDSAGKFVLRRGNADFKDSGAIMVGAASSAVPHQRLDFSNFGSRIDCFGWGENIDTTGDGWTGTAKNTYTGFFGGTSGASPIVAGAALLLQSWFLGVGNAPSTSEGMRSALSNPTTSTPSANPPTDRIGVMPDLRAIIELQQRMRSFRRPDEYLSLVQILIGIIDDSPGYIWVPGKGPVPVDPGWGRRVQTISPAQRDLLSAFTIGELARNIGNADSRKAVTSEALKALKISANDLERELLG